MKNAHIAKTKNGQKALAVAIKKGAREKEMQCHSISLCKANAEFPKKKRRQTTQNALLGRNLTAVAWLQPQDRPPSNLNASHSVCQCQRGPLDV